MEQHVTTSGGIDLCHETFGSPSDPPLVLVMGYTAQMTAWRTDFCSDLADAGHHVVRFDNRDVGRSTKTDGPLPDAVALMGRSQAGEDISGEVPYTLSDMAGDVIGLLDALSIDRAHLVGASMGGMIVQHLAFEHPERLRSVTSIMSTTGNTAVGQADPQAMTALLTPPPSTERDDVIASGLAASQIISGPLWDADDARAQIALAYDRGFHPPAAAFHLAAIAASGDRTERLRSVSVPFLVIHGNVDPLIGVSGGIATAEAVPGADLLLLDAMGHDLPRPLWPQIVGTIAGLTARADEA